MDKLDWPASPDIYPVLCLTPSSGVRREGPPISRREAEAVAGEHSAAPSPKLPLFGFGALSTFAPRF